MNRAWGIDFSDWEDLPDLPLYKQMGMSFAIIKGTMGYGTSAKVYKFYDASRKAGLWSGIYHWVDPTAPWKDQLNRYVRLCKELQPDFICADNEQWWKDWNLWYQYLFRKIPGSAVPRLDSLTISRWGSNIMAGAQQALGKILNLNYTANWFIGGYSPDMYGWIDRYPLFLAEYTHRDRRFFATWDQFYSVLDAIPGPTKPRGASTWAIRQWTSSWRLPNAKQDMDLDVFNGTPVEFESSVATGELHDQPPPPCTDEPVLERRRATDNVNIRTGPSTVYAVTGLWRRGEVAEIFETKQGETHLWGRVAPGKWCALTWSVRI